MSDLIKIVSLGLFMILYIEHKICWVWWQTRRASSHLGVCKEKIHASDTAGFPSQDICQVLKTGKENLYHKGPQNKNHSISWKHQMPTSKERVTEDEMVGWHHQLNGRELEQALEDSEGQGSLVRCSPRGHRVGHDWVTEKQHPRNGN